MDKQLLTVPQVAEALALSRAKTYQLVLRGDIPSVLIGRARRVPFNSLVEYVRDLTSATP